MGFVSNFCYKKCGSKEITKTNIKRITYLYPYRIDDIYVCVYAYLNAYMSNVYLNIGREVKYKELGLNAGKCLNNPWKDIPESLIKKIQKLYEKLSFCHKEVCFFCSHRRKKERKGDYKQWLVVKIHEKDKERCLCCWNEAKLFNENKGREVRSEILED